VDGSEIDEAVQAIVAFAEIAFEIPRSSRSPCRSIGESSWISG
jgi:hypothetical protein